MSHRQKRAATAVALAALVAGGCGGGVGDGNGETESFKQGGPPAPKGCVNRWNADPAALAFGRHAYLPVHNSRAGRVLPSDRPGRGLRNVCIVVFAAAESDREYGTVGWFSAETRNAKSGRVERGWRVMSLLPDENQEQLLMLQRSGAEQANVALEESGRITPFD